MQYYAIKQSELSSKWHKHNWVRFVRMQAVLSDCKCHYFTKLRISNNDTASLIDMLFRALWFSDSCQVLISSLLQAFYSIHNTVRMMYIGHYSIWCFWGMEAQCCYCLYLHTVHKKFTGHFLLTAGIILAAVVHRAAWNWGTPEKFDPRFDQDD